MKNLAHSLPQKLQGRLIQGAIATVVAGGSALYFGHDFLYFHNGFGGKDWNVGQGQIHVFNAHASRDVETVRQKALELANRDRQANNLSPLSLTPALSAIAQQHAEDMAARGYFSNFSPEGQAPSDRLTQAGGDGFVAENIAVHPNQARLTYRQVSQLERAVMYSRRDRENLLNPQYNQFGYGIALDPESKEAYAVQLFRADGTATTAANTITTQLASPPLASSQLASSPSTGSAVQAQPKATSELSSSDEHFRTAVNAAMAAAVATQSAQTPQQWAKVAQQWQSSINGMKAVAPGHARYATAQQKAQEYGKNFSYARQNAGGAFTVAQQPATITASSISPPPSSSVSATDSDFDTTTASEASSQALVPAQPAQATQRDHSLLIKLFLTFGSAGALIVLLTMDFGSSSEEGKDNEDNDFRNRKLSRTAHQSYHSDPTLNLSWHRRAIQEVQNFLQVKGWFNSPPQYKLTAARPAQQVRHKLYRQLLSLTQDEQTAIQLIKDNIRRHPRQPANWCCEKAIKDLQQGKSSDAPLKKDSLEQLAPVPPHSQGSEPEPEPLPPMADSPEPEEDYLSDLPADSTFGSVPDAVFGIAPRRQDSPKRTTPQKQPAQSL